MLKLARDFILYWNSNFNVSESIESRESVLTEETEVVEVAKTNFRLQNSSVDNKAILTKIFFTFVRKEDSGLQNPNQKWNSGMNWIQRPILTAMQESERHEENVETVALSNRDQNNGLN